MGFDAVQYALGRKNRKVTLPNNTNIIVGGIDMDTEIENMDTNDLFTKMLIRSLAPKTKLEFYDSSGVAIDTTVLRTTGIPLSIKTIKATSEKSNESDIITSMETYSNPAIIEFAKIDIEPNPNLNTWTFNDITINETTIFSVVANNDKGLIGKNNTTFNFINYCYAGITPSTTTITSITETDIKNGKNILQQKGDIDNLFTGNGKMFFAHESTWGYAKSIIDVVNNMNITSAFEKKEIEISNMSGSVKYIVYLANIRGNYTGSEVALKF